MEPNRSLLMIVPTAVMFGIAAYAHAQTAPTVVAPRAATSLDAVAAEESAHKAVAQALIQDAVRDLERATLQRDFTSNASELALLQHARERLSAAASQLKGARHEQTIELLADLDHAVQRAASHLGPVSAPAGETFDPRAPSRNQLAQLATEGQDVERATPMAHRLLDGNGLGSMSRHTIDAQPLTRQIATVPADAGPPSQPLETRATWPQIHWRF